jgi:hypothetical protein
MLERDLPSIALYLSEYYDPILSVFAARRGRIPLPASYSRPRIVANRVYPDSPTNRRTNMPQPSRRARKPDHGLAVPIAAALAVKIVALAVIYLAFFVPPTSAIPPAERAATAVLGLPALQR